MEASVFHDPGWGRVMNAAYGNGCRYLTARRGDRTVGVLQLVDKKSRFFGHYLCSLPYLDASGILADDPEAAQALLSKARALREQQDAQWVELRQGCMIDESLPVRTDKITLWLPLPGSPEELWKAFKSKVRNHVRKAEKEGLTVHRGTELLDEFFAIYLRTMRDLGSPSHSRGFFAQILEAFPTSARVSAVRLGERPLAAALTLTDRHGVHVPWAGSDWRVSELCANSLLYWSMLSDACEQRATRFDFGRSTRDSGTHRFKKQWGAEEIPLYWQYLLPEGAELPGLRHDSRKYAFMEACWRKLPLSVVRVLGPRIMGKLS
jgi:FemAB-related protein (PEP-CTERM system-associated)